MVSVIMGIYNCADTLSEALDSIVAQTYTDWEMILCDDGSVDDTYQIAEDYIRRHPQQRFKLLRHEKNMGLNRTLNDCLARAEGEFIARMDADDISLPARFEKELAAFTEEPELSVVSCPMFYFDEYGVWAREVCTESYPKTERLVYGTLHCHGPSMVRAEAYRAVGGYSEGKRFLRVEDRHLWLKIYATGRYGKNLSEPLYKMRDDRDAAHRRKFKYRLNGAYVSRLAIRTFHLPNWMYLYALRPILVGLLPPFLYNRLHRKKLGG